MYSQKMEVANIISKRGKMVFYHPQEFILFEFIVHFEMNFPTFASLHSKCMRTCYHNSGLDIAIGTKLNQLVFARMIVS